MSGELGVAADIATGALLAHSVEPVAGNAAHGWAAHGGATHGDPGGELCLNCGTRLVGAHCHRCGQSGHVHRTVGAIGHEIAHGVFHFEGKIWHTLPLLALRPGELTRRYVHGERARFVSPMAIFLFSVFLLFAVVANLPGWHIGDKELQNGAFAPGMEDVRAKVADQRLRAQAEIADYSRRLTKLRTHSADEKTPEKIADTQRELREAQAAVAQLANAQRYLPPPDGKTGAETSSSWLGAKWDHAKKNPQLLLYKIKSSAYKFSWALIPISLPFIWLLFPFRRNVGLYDHAVFATYSLSFMSLLVVALASLGAAGMPSDAIQLAVVLIPPFHMYRQLKGAYSLSRRGALWRTAWLLFFTSITSTLFLLLLLYLGTAD